MTFFNYSFGRETNRIFLTIAVIDCATTKRAAVDNLELCLAFAYH